MSVDVRPDASSARTLVYRPGQDTEDRRTALRSLLAASHDPVEQRSRTLGDDEHDIEFWHALVQEVGVLDMVVSERHGGLALGPDDVVMVAEELGAVLYTGPYLSSVASAVLLDGLADHSDHAATLLARVRKGALVARAQPGDDALRVERGEGSVTLTGTLRTVLRPDSADALLVTVQVGGNTEILAVEGVELDVTPRASLDPTRPLGDVRLDRTPAVPVADGKVASTAWQQAERTTDLSVIGECLGVARASLELAIKYARVRHQFGRPIGSFQAVQHRCADAFLDIEIARAVTAYAAAAVAEASDEDVRSVLAARLATATAAVGAATHCVQIHGAYGCTRDALPQSFFRRARWLSLHRATTTELRLRLATEMGA